MDYKMSLKIYRICLLCGIGLAIAFMMTDYVWVAISCVVVFVAGIVQAAVYYRCPECRTMQNLRGEMPEYCPKCGHKFEQ